MNTKICTKCKIEKPLEEFNKDKSKKDGHDCSCRTCKQEHHLLNKNVKKEYYINNIENILKNKQKYYNSNKISLSIKAKKYKNENHEYFKTYMRNYVSNRILIDPMFKLKRGISSLILISFKHKGVRKNSKTVNILGCSIEEFKIHLESKFEQWMTWDNYGNWNGISTEINQSWDIDHIIPLSSATTEEELIKLNHYSNLQPLCSYTNRYIKKNKF